MLTISQTLSNIKSKCALIPFVTAGYPSFDATIEVLHVLDKKGANIIELGVPYSDALADGYVIQESSRLALRQKVYLSQVMDIIKQVSPILKSPIVVFTYYNPILSKGIDKFIRDISLSGAKGLIIPDLPLEEADYLIQICTSHNIELILFISPASSDSRIESILAKSPGCVYLVSSYGVTGIRSNVELKLQFLIDKIKKKSDKFVMLGFGISSEEQIIRISGWNVDGIVIGSAFINAITQCERVKSYQPLEMFCQKVKTAIEEA
uniref:Tryptophan synthase alpha chain n=1 Tax=Rhodogorgon sp. TaxID=2485824 RepID=A0A3G3MI77_9FLOR|nr:tryptophan synthase alpha subunit [Rhodogorgon sp.]